MSRGYNTRTPELVERAQELRASGLIWREVGEALGVSLKTAQEWVSDPDGTMRNARKASYCGICVDCGGTTSQTHDNSQPAERCQSCATDFARTWTTETVVAAMRRWYDEHGSPPTATAWRSRGDGYWPPTSAVQRVFGGSWSAGVSAAGFAPRQRGGQLTVPRP